MPAGFWFWLLYVICILFSGWLSYPFSTGWRPFGVTLVTFILIGLLGWHVFGPVLR